MRDKLSAIQKIRSIADYQFGKEAGQKLFPEDVEIVYSKRTGRIRHVCLGEERLATLRPKNGLFSLTIAGAKRIMEAMRPQRLWVKVQEEAVPFIVKGRSVFAKHVTDADEDIRPQEEVIVINEKKEVLAVGRATLSGAEMKAFKRGVAVKVRRGVAEEVKRACPDYYYGGFHFAKGESKRSKANDATHGTQHESNARCSASYPSDNHKRNCSRKSGGGGA